MSSKVDFPKDPNSPDSIQILIDVFEETRDHHQHHHHQQQQSSAHQSKQQLTKLKQQQQQQLQKHHQNSTVSAGINPTDASGGNGYLGVQENFKRERRNSWCTSRPSETLANLKRKWFAGLTGNGNVKALTGDDNDAIEPDKSKSHSLTSLDGEGSTSEDEKLSTNQKGTAEFLDRPSSSTLCSSPVPGYRGDDRFLGDDLFSGRNARSEQDVRGHEEKGIEDKLIEVPDFPQLMGERFSLESDNLFAVKTKKMASSASTDVQASSPHEGGKRCTSPTPLRGCPDKVNRSDHPNLDLLVARHKSEGSLQRYPFKELKLSSTTQRKSSVLSKINSYRNSKKNNKAPPVETHNFVSISSSLSSSSSVSHFSAISPSSVCEVCNKPFTSKKIPLKCLDCGLLTHQDNSCKEQAVTYTCSADESRTISNALKSEEVSDPNAKFNKGNSSATTTESDSLDLPDLSLDETDAVFGSPCPPGSTTGSNTTGTSSTTGIPTVIGGNDDEEAWSLTVDEHVINSMSQSEIKRQNLIWELIRNEKHHYRILKMMLKIFVSGLKTEVGLDSAMVNQLFPGLDGLIVVHGHILKALLKQQSIRQDRRVDDLSSVLLEQFGGSNGHQMEVLYGEFCSQHERAINLYKELRRCDRKFQTFINKCVGIVACERRGIDSCILTVTQRLTKYPLLVDQILKYTEDEKESKGLSDFLHLVRSIISAVNDRVDFVAKKERFEEIFDKLDPKSTTTLGSRTIKKVDILAMEKYLRFHGWIKLKTARGRTVDSLVVVLTDWVVMLSENNHKYYFCNIDNKSSMIPLSQLLVREKDDKHEGRNFFLISSNRDAPAEMYELVCKSNSELKYWTSVLRQATALCASKTGTPLDLMSLVKSDQTQLISLIETMQTRDEEVKTSLNQKLSAVEEFYKTLDKLLPSGNMSDAIKQMALAKRQHLSPEDLVLSVHGQETNLIASLQCGAVSDPARRSLSKDRESSSLESLNSRRTSTASLFSKVSHSSSFRNIADPSLSSSTDPSLHHSSSDGVDGDGMEQVETAKVKRKTSDASVVDTKYSARATMGMLPGFLSIFCKEKDDSQDGDELHKHRKQSSLTLQQQSFNNSFQQQQQQLPQQLPVQTVLQQQSNLQHTAQQSNKISTNNTFEQQQTTVNNYSSENYNIHKQNLSSEAEERLCNFLNSVHNLSAMVLEMSTEAKKKEVQIICMTRQLEKFEKQSYPMDQQMEELRSVQNQVQLEKFQLQELRSKHQEDVDKLNEDLKQQNATFELQRAEIKSQKDELQRQRVALQRQIDLFEENKSSFSVRQQQQHHQQQQQQGLQQLSKDQQDENGSLKSLKRHERNHSNPFSLAGKPLSAIIADSAHSSRSGSPCRNAPTFSQQQGSLSNNSTMTRSQQQQQRQQQQQNNKQVRPGMTSELFEPPVDEKNGVLVTKKDAVPLLPVHLVSATNESKLDRHTSAIIADDSAQQLTQLGPVKQMFPAKLATTPTSNQSKHKQQTTITTTTTNNNNNNRSSNKITSTQSVVSKADDKRQSEVEASKPAPSMFFHNRPGNHTTKSGSLLPLYLAEKSRILPSSSSSSLQHCHFNNNNTGNNKSSSSSNSLEDENRQQHLSNNSCSNGNNINPKTGRSLFGTTKKLSQLLSPSSSSSSSPPPPPPPQSALEAMMTSTLLSPRVQFLSFPNFSGQIMPSSSPPPPLPSSSSIPPLPSSSSIPPLQSSSLPSSSSSSSSSTVTNSFKSKTSTTRTSTAKATNKVAAAGSDDDEIIFI